MKVSVFFIGRKRPGFDPAWGGQLEKAIRSQLEQSPFEPLFFSPITDERQMKDAIDHSKEAGSEAIVISQTTMGDGNLWPILLSEWHRGIVIWATPENPDNDKVSSCGLVGAHNWISGMAQAGCPPYFVYGMPETGETIEEFNQVVRASIAANRLRHARVGLIGDHAPGFLNMAVDAAAMQRNLGVRLKRIGLHEFYALIRSFSEQEVAEDRKKAEALKLPVKQGVVLDDDVWNISSRYYLALRALVEEEMLDAVAVRCWPEMPNEFGVWPYLAVPRLASDGIAICEEGDVDGALGCLLAKSLGCPAPAFNTDWLEHDDDSILVWHGGATPLEMCQPAMAPGAPTINVHYNTGKPIVIDAELLYDMPVTLFRFWRFQDRYSMAIVEGRVARPPRHIDGCAGSVQVPGGGVKRFFRDVSMLGMPHHLIVMKGRYGERLQMIAERYRPEKIEVVRRIGAESYGR